MTTLPEGCAVVPPAAPLLLPLLVLAGLGLLAGALLLLLRHRHRTRAVVAGLALLVGGLTLAGPPPPAAAAMCAPGGTVGGLTLTQTSALTGLAPGVAPRSITGSLRNDSDESIWIDAVVVRVGSVTGAPGAPAGTCGPPDYVVRDPLMPLGRSLGPDAVTAFSGATIAFNSTSVNQDACKGATVQLRYEPAPLPPPS